MSDAVFLKQAIELARRATNPAPNPRVGAVIVRNGQIIGRGWHEVAGEPHAEIVAIRKAGKRAAGATLYLTLEPCCHRGRTPPCTDAILKAGIKKVVIGMRDPNPVAAGGMALLRQHGVTVQVGIREQACRDLNQIWLKNLEKKLPYTTLKLALTSDGSLLTPPSKKWITSTASRAQVQKMRAQHDAILVGVNTILTDNPRLTVRGASEQPIRIVLDPSGRIPRDAGIFREAGKTIIVTKQPTKFSLAQNIAVSSFRLALILKKLYGLGITSVFVEGGAVTARKFLQAECIDRVELFFAPPAPSRPKLFGKVLKLMNLQTGKTGRDTLHSGLLKKY